MLRSVLRAVLPLTLATLAMGSLPAMAQEINFGLISTESTAHLKADWQPILDDLSKKTGYKINAFFASDYAGVIEAMRFGKVQVAWMGNKSGMEAVDRANAEVFGQAVYADGSPGYWSILLTHKDSSVKTLDDVLKKPKTWNYGAGDPNSTSGSLVPGYYLFALNDIDPKTHFKTARSANHESNLLAALNKQVDVAICNTEVFDKFERREPEQAKNIRVLWKSPLIAADPMLWRIDLAADQKAKIKAFFMSYGRGAGAEGDRERALLGKLLLGPFKDSSNAQLIPFRQLELFKDRAKIVSDDNMDAASKQAKLADIDKKLAVLAVTIAAKQ